MFVGFWYIQLRDVYTVLIEPGHTGRSGFLVWIKHSTWFSIRSTTHDNKQPWLLPFSALQPGYVLQRLESDGIVMAECLARNEDDRGTLAVSCQHRQGYVLRLGDAGDRCSEHIEEDARVGSVSK